MATASVERNLRFLGDEDNERELNGSDDPTGSDTSSPAGTTTPEVTTKTEVTTTTSSGSGDATTTSSTDPSDTTTASTGSGSTVPPPDVDPTPEVVDTVFSCYFDKDQYPELSDDKTKFEIKKITCNIPDKTPVDEATTAAQPESRRLVDDVRNITIADKTSEKCTEIAESKSDKPNLYTCEFGTANIPKVDKVIVDVVSNYFPDNKTTVYLGCNVGDNLHAKGERISNEKACPAIFETGNYTGSCVVDSDNKKKQVFKMEFEEDDVVCNCTATWMKPGQKTEKKIPDTADRKIGTTVDDFKPCKGGKTMKIECTVNGWVDVDEGKEECQWDDGSVSSTVSALLLVVVALLSIIF